MKLWGRILIPGCLAALLLIGIRLFLADAAAVSQDELHGLVLDAAGPLSGAHVRVRATDNATVTAADGSFTLTGLTTGITIPVTAWYPGYYISETRVVLPSPTVTLTLSPYPTTDIPDYDWLFSHRSDSPPAVDYGCDNCHAGAVVSQWQNNAHAQTATSPRFLSLYNGSDVTGSQVISPGYALDFPGTAGNCATCHAPGAAANAPFTTDMNTLSPPESDGVFCDFCHKTGGIYLNPATGLPYPNSPGVLSHDLRRPPAGQQLFFGPYDDVADPDTYLPLIRQSQFCAACHNFSFWGTPIYQSFAEWLDSPYAEEGVHCQACHMFPDGVTTNFAPGAGGFERDPMSIPTHSQPGASDLDLLQNTVSMTLSTRQEIDHLIVTVSITNTGAGHHVPTDHPGRHIILTVHATGAQGQALSQQAGPSVPVWGGLEAGMPGTAYAKILRDAQSGDFPVVSYWKQAFIQSDNRIPARERATTTYSFETPAAAGTVTVTAELRFRRTFQAEIDARGWATPDIVMEEIQTTVPLRPHWRLYLPLFKG
jgi:hypothetical protein